MLARQSAPDGRPPGLPATGLFEGKYHLNRVMELDFVLYVGGIEALGRSGLGHHAHGPWQNRPLGLVFDGVDVVQSASETGSQLFGQASGLGDGLLSRLTADFLFILQAITDLLD